MKLAIQVVPYFSSKQLSQLLESLKAQTFTDWELFVCENSCDAGERGRIQAMLETSGILHHLYLSPQNIGFAGGHQALFVMHQAPFVMLLNDDAMLEPGYLEATMKRIESDAKIASVTGLIYRWDDGPVCVTEATIVDTAGLEYRCLAQIVDRFSGRNMKQIGSALTVPSEVFGVSGAVGLYRRSAIEQAGGLFDPAWFMYKEDVDLALRLKQAGFSAWFEPMALGWHKRGLKQKSNLLARFLSEWRRPRFLRQCAYVNQWRIYKRHFRWSLGWRDIGRSVVIEVLRSAGTFVVSPGVFFLSWYDIIRA